MMKSLLLFCLIAFSPLLAEAAPTIVDKSIGSTFSSGATSITATNQTVSGSNTLLLCSVHLRHSTQTANSVAWDPAGANEAMTAGVSDRDGTQYTRLFTLVNPTPGTNKSVTATLSAGAGSIGRLLQCVSFSGVHQTTPIENAACNQSEPASLTVTSATGDLVWAASSSRGDNAEPTAGTDETDESGTGNYRAGTADPANDEWSKHWSQAGAASVVIQPDHPGTAETLCALNIKAAPTTVIRRSIMVIQ